MRQSDAARGAARPSVPAHAVEIRPAEPFTPEVWAELVDHANHTMHNRPPAQLGHGVVAREVLLQ